jgi:hypothetical protein
MAAGPKVSSPQHTSCYSGFRPKNPGKTHWHLRASPAPHLDQALLEARSQQEFLKGLTPEVMGPLG